MKNFVTEFTNQKMNENEEIIRITFYELRVKYNLTEAEVDEFLMLARTRLENLDYKVYFTNARYKYKNINQTVQENELMIAVKENYK